MWKKILITMTTLILLIIFTCFMVIFLQDNYLIVEYALGEAQDLLDEHMDLNEYTLVEDSTSGEEEEQKEREVFISNGGYYYELLNSEEKDLYQDIVTAYLAYETEVDLSAEFYMLETTQVSKVHQYVLLDYPEIFWIDEQNTINYIDTEEGKSLVSLNTTLLYSEEMITSYNEALELVVDELEMLQMEASSDYEKALIIYEYIILHCEYDTESALEIINGIENTTNVKESVTIVGCLINEKAVCTGYSKAYTYLMNIFGIETCSVAGSADGIGHAWNIILLDNQYYNVDCTWGDPVIEGAGEDYISYSYFCLTTALICNTHTQTEDVAYPNCTSMDYNYYVYNGLCYTEYDYETIKQLIGTAVNERQETVTFSFYTYDAYETALQLLLEGDLGTILGTYADQLENQCSYTSSDELYMISVNLVYQ